MKLLKNKIFLVLLATAFVVSACEKELETEGISKITYFPIFELEGEESYVLQYGEAFTIPGAVAREKGVDIPVTTLISGTYFNSSVGQLNTSSPDVYTVTHSAINVDGFPGTAQRTITVLPPTGDLVNSIEGVYTANVGRNGPAAAPYLNLGYVYIVKTGTNTYQISDIIGGYYDLGRGFGPGYAGTGATIKANSIATNNFDFNEATGVGIGAFGGAADMTAMTVNSAAKEIDYKVTWDAGYTFDIKLKQVQL